VATLQLKGEGNAAAALRTVTPLQNNEARLNARQLEVLGAVLAANGRTADAVRVLERAVNMPVPTVGCRVALAMAYHKNRQPADRDRQLAQAEGALGRSAREQAELVAAKVLRDREKP
jgi:hypothetical protein